MFYYVKRVFALILVALLALGLLAAKTFGFSVGWILWPVGVVGLIVFGFILAVERGRNPFL